MSYSNVGKIWTTESFSEYLKTLKKPGYAKSIVIHHTAAPSLKQRPKGFTAQHILNIKSYYMSLGWNRGPHLFTDDDQIFGMTPLHVSGIHAASFNKNSIGIEVLGNYDAEDSLTGRGLDCMQTAAITTKALFAWLDIPVNENTLKFHRDDPKTSKTCPGRHVKKDWFISLMKNTPTVKPTANRAETSIIDFVIAFKGYDYNSAIKLLKTRSGMTYFNGIWLETARFDRQLKTTVADTSELNSIFRKIV